MTTSTHSTPRATGSALLGAVLAVVALVLAVNLPIPVSDGNDGWTYVMLTIFGLVAASALAATITHRQRRTLVGFALAAGTAWILFWSLMGWFGSGVGS